MSWLDDARLAAWYRLRRHSRQSRNKVTRELFASAVAALGPDDICIDCGANIGTITRALAANGSLVHAFEPDPDAFAALQKNCGALANVNLHNKAVAAASGSLKLYRGKGPAKRGGVSEGSTLIAGKTNVSQTVWVAVDAIDFCSFIRSLGRRVAIVKMDIEGAEVDVLNSVLDAGMIESIGYLFVETHEKQIPSLRRATMELDHRCQSMPHVHLDWW